MADPAAAAAAAATLLNADKQLDTMYKTVGSLKDTEYHKFQKQLQLQAYAYGWPSYILSSDPAAAVLQNPTQKQELDARNAYLVLMNKTQGHTVENLLEACPQGDARQAYLIVHRFFHRNSQTGRTTSYKDFYGATMATTDTNIVEWIATVPRLAKILEQAGGQAANEGAQLSVLLDGLLPEFEPVQTILNLTTDLRLSVAVTKIMDFAQSHKLEQLTKGGGKHAKHNTFTVQDGAPKEDECRGWKRGNCKFGAFCKFKHTGEGGCAPKAQQYPNGQYPGRARNKTSSSQPTAGPASPTSFSVLDNTRKIVCTYCNSNDHEMRRCPHLQMDSKAGANVHMVNENEAVDYIFCTHAHAESDDNAHSADANAVPRSVYGSVAAALAGLFFMLMLVPTTLADVSSGLSEQLNRGSYKTAVVVTILAVLSYTALAHPFLPGEVVTANVQASSFFNHDKKGLPSVDHEWCSDSGTNRFVTNNINDFVSGSVNEVSTIVAVGGGNVTSPCHGTVLVKSLDYGCTMQCMNVLYIPECGKKLMPASPFIRKGCSLVLDDYDKVNLRAGDGTPILSGCELGGLYYYRCKTLHKAVETPAANSNARNPASDTFFGLPMGKNIGTAAQDFSRRLLESHWAYGHLHFDKLRRLLGLKKGDDPECPACTLAKSRKTALSKKTHKRSTHVNHRMFMDLGFTRNSEYCFQLCIDDYTRESYLDILDSKNEVLPAWETLKDHLENEHAPWKFAFIHTDGEPIYSTDRWSEHCKANGIEHEFSSRYRHDQLGVAERAMQSIGVPFRCMMIQGCAPESDIPDCLRHANLIRNNSPTKANNGRTPREKAAGMKLPPNKRLLKGPLFCLVFAHVYEEERVKHAPRGIACVYLGYDDVNNAYKVKEWVSGKKYYTADLTFHPNTFPYRANPNRTPGWLLQYNDLAPHVIEGKPIDAPSDLRRSQRQHEYQYSAGQAVRDVPDVDTPPDAVNAVDFSNYIVHTFGPDPTTWDEAINSKYANEWIEAQLAEKASFAHHGVYDLVPRSTAWGKKIFKPRPVLKIKVNPPTEEHPHGSIDKFKYRLTLLPSPRC